MNRRPRALRAARSGPACRAFNLLELLVVIAIIGLLVALLLPAVQSAREMMRRSQCQNNLRQIGLSVNYFENVSRYLPAAAYGDPYNLAGPMGSVFTKLLPFLEQANVADQYDWSQNWYAAANQFAVNQPIPTFRCPSALGNDVQTGLSRSGSSKDAPSLTAAVGDYTAMYCWGYPFAVPTGSLLDDPFAVSALSPLPESAKGILSGAAQYRNPRLKDTTDGTSRTFTFVERAGNTQHWVLGRLVAPTDVSSSAWAPWAGQGCIWPFSYESDGVTYAIGLGPCNINCNNHDTIYAFHAGGANSVFLDASVHFLPDDTDPLVLYAMVSRSRGEIFDVP